MSAPVFPTLKTGAVAQYPATRAFEFRNQVVRFLDGTEQRYRDSAGPLHRWSIALDLLDEGEYAAVEAFFAACQGVFTSFAFADPWDGHTYNNCSLESDGIDMTAMGELQDRTSLTVIENRG